MKCKFGTQLSDWSMAGVTVVQLAGNNLEEIKTLDLHWIYTGFTISTALKLQTKLCGAIVLGLGIWLRVDRDSWRLLHIATGDQSSRFLSAAAILLISVGGMVAVVGFLGCCGAIIDNTSMILVYSALLTVVLLLQISSAILALVFQQQVSLELRSNMQMKFSQISRDDDTMQDWLFMENHLQCCGLDGRIDWEESHARPIVYANKTAPYPCCLYPSHAVCHRNYPRHATVTVPGCTTAMTEWLRQYVRIAVGMSCSFACVQLLGLALSFSALRPCR